MNNNQNATPYLMSDFAQEFRNRIGDTGRSVPVSQIMTYLSNMLNRLARMDGMERLYDRHDVWELASINHDGTPSAAWNLGNIGTIIDIRKMRLLKVSDGKVCRVPASYVEYEDFLDSVTLPEQNAPGDPNIWTIEQLGAINRLVLDRPPFDLMVADMVYSAFHPRITTQDDEIRIAYAYMDILLEMVIVLHKIESTDNATARALWEDIDVYTADLKELLAKRKVAAGYRRVARSF